jgi:hypothetical protein
MRVCGKVALHSCYIKIGSQGQCLAIKREVQVHDVDYSSAKSSGWIACEEEVTVV